MGKHTAFDIKLDKLSKPQGSKSPQGVGVGRGLQSADGVGHQLENETLPPRGGRMELETYFFIFSESLR